MVDIFLFLCLLCYLALWVNVYASVVKGPNFISISQVNLAHIYYTTVSRSYHGSNLIFVG